MNNKYSQVAYASGKGGNRTRKLKSIAALDFITYQFVYIALCVGIARIYAVYAQNCRQHYTYTSVVSFTVPLGLGLLTVSRQNDCWESNPICYRLTSHPYQMNRGISFWLCQITYGSDELLMTAWPIGYTFQFSLGVVFKTFCL